MNDYSDLTPSGLAHELGNQLQKLSRLQAEADQIPGVQENIERLRALLGIIPEQPSYKHPEKDIFNLSEDEDGTETMLSDSFPNAAGGVTERKVFKDGSASIKSTDAAGGSVTLKSDPITPMADLSANQVHKDELRSFAGFDVSEMDLTEGVLAEAVSANGEKVVITE